VLHLQPRRGPHSTTTVGLRTSAKPLTDSASAASLRIRCKSTRTEVHLPRSTVCTLAVFKARVTACNASLHRQACFGHFAAHRLVVASTALTSPSLSCARGVNSCVATRLDLRSLRKHLTVTPRATQTVDLGLLMPRVQQHRATDSVKPVHLGIKEKIAPHREKNSRMAQLQVEPSQHHSSTSTCNPAPHGLEDCERKLAGQPVGLWK
jgi:hypothetical protein